MTKFSYEITGTRETIQAIRQTARRLPQNISKAVEVTSRRVKDTARALAADTVSADGPARHYPSTIGYEITRTGVGGSVEGTIGPKKGMAQAGLPLEVGTPYRGATPIMEPALLQNRDDFLNGINKAVEDSL